MIKVLFVCTGNTCRSPMARALLLQRLQKRNKTLGTGGFKVWSAGLFAKEGLPASPEAIKVMNEEGIDIRHHCSLLLRDVLITNADLVLTMTANQRNYIWERFPEKSQNTYTLSEFAGDGAGEVEDPYGQGAEAYRRTLDQLKILVDMVLSKI